MQGIFEKKLFKVIAASERSWDGAKRDSNQGFQDRLHNIRPLNFKARQ